MLVCNVSLLRRRAAIAVDLAETTTAADALGTGNVVFATLVDDPALVRDRVDAYLGEIMLEAANAAATFTVSSIRFAAVVEEAAAASTTSAIGTFTYSGTVVEPATAVDMVNAATFATYNVSVAETAAASSAQDAELPTIVMARNAMVAGLEPISIGAMSGARRLRSGTMVVSSAVPTVYTASMFEPAAATDRQTDGSVP
jgi:hypothetical protein